jgi:hypothetical protein
MLTADIRINGALIGHIYCVNEKTINPPGDDRFHPVPIVTSKWYEYSYEYYRPGEGIIKGAVQHYRPNGAAALLKEICEDIETKGGK